MSLDRGSIEDCAVAESASKNTWADMVDFAAGYNSSIDFFDALLPIEDEFREMYFKDVSAATTKSGKWKKTYKNSDGERVYILPNAWQTSKSVAGKAIDANIDMIGKGQSAVAKKARERLSTPKTPINVVLSSLQKAKNVVCESKNSFSDEDKKWVVNYCEAIIGEVQ